MSVRFDVREVSKPILAASVMVERGCGLWLHRNGAYILGNGCAEDVGKHLRKHGEVVATLEARRNTFVLPLSQQRWQHLPDRRSGRSRRGRGAAVAAGRIGGSEGSLCEGRTPTPLAGAGCTARARPRALQELVQVVRHWPGIRRAPQAQPRREHDHACGAGLLPSLEGHGRGSAMALVLVLRPHGVVGAYQLLRKEPDPFTVDCVLSFLDLCSVTKDTIQAHMEPSTQALLSEVRRRRFHKTLVEVPPNHSHQSNMLVENVVRRVRTHVGQALREDWSVSTHSALGTHAMHREGRRQELVGATSRTRVHQCTGGNWGNCRLQARASEPRQAGASLGCRFFLGSPRRERRGYRWHAARRRVRQSTPEYNAFLCVPWNPRGLQVEAPMASGRRRYITKAIESERGLTPRCPACVGVRVHPHGDLPCEVRGDLQRPGRRDAADAQRELTARTNPTRSM